MNVLMPTFADTMRYGRGYNRIASGAAGVAPSLCGSITRGIGYRNLGGRLAAIGSGKALPYDAELEWMRSDGTQYIEAPITLDGYSEVDIKFFIFSGVSAFGARQNWNDRIYTFFYHANTTDNYICYGFGYGNQLFGSYSDPIRLTYLRNETKMNAKLRYGASSVITMQFDLVEFTTPGRCILFGFLNGTEVRKSSSKIYYFTASNQTERVDMIPVRVGNIGYMYDRANPTGGPLGNGLYPNSGTGSFILGPDKT